MVSLVQRRFHGETKRSRESISKRVKEAMGDNEWQRKGCGKLYGRWLPLRQAEFTTQEEAAAKKASRSFKKYQYRGVELENLLDLSNEEFINVGDLYRLEWGVALISNLSLSTIWLSNLQLVHARARRRFQRGLKRRPMGLIKKLRKAKTEAGPNEKPAMVKTHLRDMIIVPEMIGSVVGVYVSDLASIRMKRSLIFCSERQDLHHRRG